MRSREEQIKVLADDFANPPESYQMTEVAELHINEAIQRGRELERADMADVPSRVVRGVAELPDRTSPDGNPEMMLVTPAELIGIVRRALGGVGDGHDSDCATHNEPAFPNGPCNCMKRDRERLDWLAAQIVRVRAHAPYQPIILNGTYDPDEFRDAIDDIMNAENGQ